MRRSKTIVIGERKLVPKLPDENARYLEMFRERRPLFAALEEDSLTRTSSSGRTLRRVYGLDPSEVVLCNLLSPARASGAWDGVRARRYALLFVEHARNARCRLVLLGRRVHRAFMVDDVPFCERTTADGVPCLVLPHPSGRNRWLNEEANREACRSALKKFVEDE